MQRFKALDVFRGMTICFMIIVNTTGDWGQTFSLLLHAPWHGFTPTDLVFPSFLFAVGNALAFVKNRWAEKALKEVIGKILRRTFLIFILGFILYWFPFVEWTADGSLVAAPLSETRIWGVLQRIAVCYFAAALMVFFFNNRQLVIASVVMLLAYWWMMWAFGDYTLENNFPRIVDLYLFGPNHLYGGEGIPFDPEGLLSTLPAIVNVIGGYLVGVYLIEGQTINYEKLAKILLMGCALMTIAYFWHFLFPINKKIWTSSYVLLTVGLAMVILAFIIYSIDFVKNPPNYYFFEVFGKNPLIIYLFSGYLAVILYFIKVDGKQSLYNYIYVNGFKWIGPYYGAFAFAFTFMMVCWLLGWWMDKRKIYIRV